MVVARIDAHTTDVLGNTMKRLRRRLRATRRWIDELLGLSLAQAHAPRDALASARSSIQQLVTSIDRSLGYARSATDGSMRNLHVGRARLNHRVLRTLLQKYPSLRTDEVERLSLELMQSGGATNMSDTYDDRVAAQR